MGNRKDYLQGQVVWVCERLDTKEYGANHDGNVSVRFGDNLLATPSAEYKGLITNDMVIELDMDGKKVSGIGKSFSEIKMHIEAYNSRAGINAVVHAHPPYLTARGLLGLDLLPSLPEALVSIGEIVPVTNFAMPGSPESFSEIRKILREVDVFMMPGNGVLAVGADLEQAYLRLELAEHLAKIDYLARTMGTPMELSSEDKEKLLAKRASIGLGPKNYNFSSVAPSPTPVNNTKSKDDALKELIANEIKKALQGS
jgi:L-fuculose-phosphate aldolase